MITEDDHHAIEELLERVTAFMITYTYLGSLLTTTGGIEEDAEATYRNALAALFILGPV